ncbi:hypothetical protein LSAT2_029236 [Lamellibrachia satsuma]|nr:hypothetical protein LSAT2_029236 [Lamellibrachia satsuma]
MNCHKIDIDKDGKADCIASGRTGTVVAFDPRKGKVLWQVDQSVVHQTWNVYNVLVMSDFTQDGVPEVLLSQGGDPKFDAECATDTAPDDGGGDDGDDDGGGGGYGCDNDDGYDDDDGGGCDDGDDDDDDGGGGGDGCDDDDGDGDIGLVIREI